MKSICNLKNPDKVFINGKIFQVVNRTEGLYDFKRDDLEIIIEMVAIGEESISPSYYQSYMSKEPEKIKFEIYDKDLKECVKEKIQTIYFK